LKQPNRLKSKSNKMEFSTLKKENKLKIVFFIRVTKICVKNLKTKI